jgi:hypothetical protein
MRTDEQPQSEQGPERTGRANKSTPWTAMAWVYLALSLAGAIFPWLANLEFIQTYGSGFDLGLFASLANANPASQFVARDLAVGATAVTVWIVVESRRLKMRGLGWVLLGCITIAFGFGAPLFLHLRERRLAELQHQGIEN